MDDFKLTAWLQVELVHKSPRTLQTYIEAVRKLWKERPMLKLATLSSADVQSLYTNWPGSINALSHYDRVWRAIFARVEKRGKLSLGLPSEWQSPWKGVERVRAHQTEKVPLSGKDVRKLLQKMQLSFQERVFVKLLATTGMRVSEALGIEERDVVDKAIRIIGKGGRSRLVYIDDTLAEDLFTLHLTLGEKQQLFPWTRAQAYELVQKAGEQAGFPHLHPHLLRHTCISIMLNEKQAPLKFVQEQVGHRSVVTTMRYSHLLPDQKKEMASKYAV